MGSSAVRSVAISERLATAEGVSATSLSTPSSDPLPEPSVALLSARQQVGTADHKYNIFPLIDIYTRYTE